MFFRSSGRPYIIAFFISAFALFGGAFLMVWNQYEFEQRTVAVSGRVINLVPVSSSGSVQFLAPIVGFETVEHVYIEFQDIDAGNPAHYQKDQLVEVYYSRTNPYQARIKESTTLWTFPIVFGLVSMLCFVIGTTLAVTGMQRYRFIRWLQEHGQRIVASNAHTEIDSSMNVRGEHPYVIRCEWMDQQNSRLYSFHSDHIWSDPRPYMHGDEAVVLIDPRDPRRYYVDISFLPQQG